MTTAFIFHGTGGYPEENWFPWLKNELEKKSMQVFVPQFPTPERQSLEAWLKIFKDYKQYLNQETLLIGHSLGGIFLLRLLERIKNPVKAAFLIGTPIGVKPIKNYEADESFSGFNFKWPIIKGQAKHFIVYQSDNDPYVSLGNGEGLAKEVGTKLSFIPNAGHFNTTAGYTKFEDLLSKISQIL